MKKKQLFIIGLAILIGLGVRAKGAHAIYSPRLSIQAAIIRQHIMDSRAVNGSQTVLQEIERFKAYDKATRDPVTGQPLKETGLAGNARVAQDLVFNTTLGFLVNFPFDSLFMVFNYNVVNNEWISQCLRDDIWNLETLRDMVGSEMIKAYLMRDPIHGDLLMEDYKYLITNLDLLREYGAYPGALIDATDKQGNPIQTTSTKYFFGNDGTDPNYYKDVEGWTSNETGCPESEFASAFQEVVNASNTLATLGSGGGSNWSWGSILAMAQANARIRASQWIRANQLSLTLGGEQGGGYQSLVKGGGWDKFVGDVKTQWQVAEGMAGLVTPLFDWSKYKAPATAANTTPSCMFYTPSDDLFRDCTLTQKQEYDECKKDLNNAVNVKHIPCGRFRNAAESISISNKLNAQQKLQEQNTQTLEDVRNAFTYSLTLDSVGEQNLYQLDQIVWDINMNIKRGYETVDKQAGLSIPTLTRKLTKMHDKQCANKQ